MSRSSSRNEQEVPSRKRGRITCSESSISPHHRSSRLAVTEGKLRFSPVSDVRRLPEPGKRKHLCALQGIECRTRFPGAIRQAQETGARLWEQRAHLAEARILRAIEGAAARDAIEASLERTEALIAETGAQAQTPFVIEERARFAMVLRDPVSARRLLEEARRAFDATGAAGHAARLANELAFGGTETTGTALGPSAQEVK